MKIVVIGGGFVGQLVQYAVPSARVLDWRKTPPKNHLETRIGPQYLWEPIPGVESISFDVTTLVDSQEPNPESILAYKRKIGKEQDGGDWGLQFRHRTVGYSSLLPVPRVEYDRQVRMVDLMGHCLGLADWTTIEYDVLVSTIPMYSLLDLMIVGPSYNCPFHFDPIFMSFGSNDCWRGGEMVLNYVSEPDNPVYRETTYGDEKFYESLKPSMGSRRIVPGKIHPHPENEVILANLATYECFCFGRFATWRPDELAHESWKEIESWKGVMGL